MRYSELNKKQSTGRNSSQCFGIWEDTVHQWFPLCNSCCRKILGSLRYVLHVQCLHFAICSKRPMSAFVDDHIETFLAFCLWGNQIIEQFHKLSLSRVWSECLVPADWILIFGYQYLVIVDLHGDIASFEKFQELLSKMAYLYIYHRFVWYHNHKPSEFHSHVISTVKCSLLSWNSNLSNNKIFQKAKWK